TSTILTEHLQFKRFRRPGLNYFRQSALSALAPLRRDHVPPSHATPRDFSMVVLQQAKEGFIGPKDRAFGVPGHDSENGRVHQAPDLRLAIFEIAIEPGVLQRHSRLRDEHLENCYAVGGEHARG